MDIFERIRQDHQTLRTLLERARNADGDQRAAFDALRRELWAHGRVEEAVFYAAIADAGETRAEAREGLNEHHLIDGLLEELNTMEAGGGFWTAKLQVLGEIVRHHIEEEERELFGQARKVLSGERAQALAGAFDDRKAHALAALAPLPR